MAKPAYKTDTNFGIWLDKAMAEHDPPLDQGAVASLIGVGQSVISKWRRGVPNPKRHDVERLARALGADIDTALIAAGFIPGNYGIQEIAHIPDDERRILAFYRGAPERDKRIIQMMADSADVEPDDRSDDIPDGDDPPIRDMQ